MQSQKFDPTKPYGAVYGHPDASYEQNGILYGGEGEIVGGSGSTVKESKKPVKELNSSGLAEFLTGLLEGGPIMQVNIKRESEKAGHAWDDILSMSAEMGLKKFKKGVAMMWQLPEGDA
jgi:hypothetical protein